MDSVIRLFAILSAITLIGFTSTDAMAESVRDSGSMNGTYVERHFQAIPDQRNHVLVLSHAVATNRNTSGTSFLDGFSANIREIADLNRGTGPSQGYVIFSKGPDQLVVKINGVVTTTIKEGQPNTTFKGSWVTVSGAGSLASDEGEGTYSGHFTAEDRFHVNWEGSRSRLKDAVARSKE